jgi:hypothetical protein
MYVRGWHTSGRDSLTTLPVEIDRPIVLLEGAALVWLVEKRDDCCEERSAELRVLHAPPRQERSFTCLLSRLWGFSIWTAHIRPLARPLHFMELCVRIIVKKRASTFKKHIKQLDITFTC